MVEINASNPDISHLYSIGPSVRSCGCWLWVSVLTGTPSASPSFKYVANMHGNEVLGRVLLLQLIDDFVRGYRNNEDWSVKLLNSTRIHILPTMNPDGFDEAVIGWLRMESFVLSANLHGGALVASYPYDNSNGGGMQDYNYVWAQCLELTLEVSCCKFPPQNQLPALWTDNKKSLLAFIMQIHLGVKGRVFDGSGVPVQNAVVEVKANPTSANTPKAIPTKANPTSDNTPKAIPSKANPTSANTPKAIPTKANSTEANLTPSCNYTLNLEAGASRSSWTGLC
ncbi:hypothetical protein F7725_022080, partial [Dissostichus mawsoni]